MEKQTYLDPFLSRSFPQAGQTIGLTAGELDLLSQLAKPASRQANTFSQAFLERTKIKGFDPIQGLAESSLAESLAEWFGSLFEPGYSPNALSRNQHQGLIHRPTGVYLRDLLASLDLILDHGREVARQSATPDRAQQAFEKQLALDLMVNQVHGDRYLVRLVSWALSD